jgi:hypothetical protein
MAKAKPTLSPSDEFELLLQELRRLHVGITRHYPDSPRRKATLSQLLDVQSEMEQMLREDHLDLAECVKLARPRLEALRKLVEES